MHTHNYKHPLHELVTPHLQHVVAHGVPKIPGPNLSHKVPPIEGSSCEAQPTYLQHETAYARDSVPFHFELVKLWIPLNMYNIQKYI